MAGMLTRNVCREGEGMTTITEYLTCPHCKYSRVSPRATACPDCGEPVKFCDICKKWDVNIRVGFTYHSPGKEFLRLVKRCPKCREKEA